MDKMIPYSGGPKRLAFHIRKFRTYGSTSLLISNRFGVWSVVRCRHVKKTRFLRFYKLKAMAGELEKLHVLLRKLGMNDEQVKFWRHRLVDIYWDAAPPGYRAGIIDYFRLVKRNRRIRHFVFYLLIAILLAELCVLAAGLLMSDVFLGFCIMLLGVVVIYKTGLDAWRSVCDDADKVFVRMLDQLACRCE